mmetsp:Transcript_36417/g.90971  ORF Transcript_36417/g.90971 Transcript_36417/m.90971 type:complete len:297 (-) Transcript_36417:263-1153(-)
MLVREYVEGEFGEHLVELEGGRQVGRCVDSVTTLGVLCHPWAVVCRVVEDDVDGGQDAVLLLKLTDCLFERFHPLCVGDALGVVEELIADGILVGQRIARAALACFLNRCEVYHIVVELCGRLDHPRPPSDAAHAPRHDRLHHYRVGQNGLPVAFQDRLDDQVGLGTFTRQLAVKLCGGEFEDIRPGRRGGEGAVPVAQLVRAALVLRHLADGVLDVKARLLVEGKPGGQPHVDGVAIPDAEVAVRPVLAKEPSGLVKLHFPLGGRERPVAVGVRHGQLVDGWADASPHPISQSRT